MPNPQITFPANFVPVMAMAYANPDNSAQPISLSSPLPVAGDEPNAVSGSAAAAAVVVSAATNGCQGGSFQITGAGSGNTITFEQSNDNATWVAMLVSNSTIAAVAPSATATAAGIYAFSSAAAYVRARVSTYGSGTVSIVLAQKSAVQGQSVYGVLGSSNQYIGNVNNSSGFLDSTTALGASATYTGTARATSSYGAYCSFLAFAFADVAGTLVIDWTCDNGTTWQTLSSVAVGAGTSQVLKANIPAFAANVSLRARYVNGAAAQATFRLATSFVSN